MPTFLQKCHSLAWAFRNRQSSKTQLSAVYYNTVLIFTHKNLLKLIPDAHWKAINVTV